MSWLKSWLQGSGYYVNVLSEKKRDRYEEHELQDDLNPFEQLYRPDGDRDSLRRGLARVYFEDFWTGLDDTFHILIGKHYLSPNEAPVSQSKTNYSRHFSLSSDIGRRLMSFFNRPVTENKNPGQIRGRKGILDILLFPAISRRLMSFCNRPPPHSFIGKMLFRGAQVLAYPIIGTLELARFALAAALTFALFSIVALVHLFTRARVPFIIKKATQLKVDNAKVTWDDQNNNSRAPYSFPEDKITGETTIGYIDRNFPPETWETSGSISVSMPFAASTRSSDLSPENPCFERRMRTVSLSFSLFSPEKYKTKEQQEALKAFMFINNDAREYCRYNPSSPFAKAYNR